MSRLVGRTLVCIGLALAILRAGPVLAVPPDQVNIDIQTALAELAAYEATPEGLSRTASVLIDSLNIDDLIERSGTEKDYGPTLWPLESIARYGTLLLPKAQSPGTEDLTPVATRTDLLSAFAAFAVAKDFADNPVVLQAQAGETPIALSLESGVADIRALARLMAENGFEYTLSGRSLTLNAPVVIWPGAVLRIKEGEELVLSRTTGAFILNFGTLEIEGATVRSEGDRNLKIKRFRPFIVTVDAGSLVLRDATIKGLGFGETLKFSGLSVWRRSFRGVGGDVEIRDTMFDDLISVTIQGALSPRIVGNRFREMNGLALVINRSQDALITGNIISGGPTNAIRLEGASGSATVQGNVLLGGDYAGIIVTGGSTGASVSGNIVWKRGGSGIQIRDSACSTVSGNLLIGNGQKGIEIRSSPDAIVRRNSILDNHHAAIWVSEQSPGTTTILEENAIAFNGIGFATARAGTIIFRGNDITRQGLQIVSGDVIQDSKSFVANLDGALEVIVGASPDTAPKGEIIECIR